MDPSPAPSLDRVYAPPSATEPELAEMRQLVASRLRARAGQLLATSFIVFLGAMLALSVSSRAGTVVLSAAAIIALAGTGHSIAAIAKGAGVSSGWSIAGTATVGLANIFMTGLGALSAFLSTITFTRGRQIRVRGRILLPPVVQGDAWTGAGIHSSTGATVVDIDHLPTRDALAAQWRENGRTEHASVAAFARLTLDLIALGAPPELVADANRDALDEIRHAELCFGLAWAIDGRVESPGAFPAAARARTLSRARTLALAELAVDSLVDGALHEGVSARIIAKLARRCEAPAIQSILKEIAADEGRHAHHGWDVVRWCLSEGGEPVARALEGALRALPATMASPILDEARDGSWERWGIMGEALEADEYRAALADLERRVAQAITSGRAARQPAFGYVS